MTTLKEVEDVHAKWLSLDHDPDMLRIVLATVLANRLDGKPLWITITGPSGSGKTAIVRGIAGSGECRVISSFTPAAFASATTGSSFLEELNNRVAIITDFSTIASQTMDTVSQLMSILRDCYDGRYERRTGRSTIPIVWEGKFGLIACSTPEATDRFIIGNSLGERFLVVRTNVAIEPQLEAILNSAYDANSQDDMRDQLEDITSAFLDEFVTDGAVVPSELKNIVITAGRAIAACRTNLSHDRESRHIDFPVGDSIEVPTRVVQQIKMLAAGLSMLGITVPDVKRILYRVSRDSMDTRRLRVLQSIAAGNATAASISRVIGINPVSVGRHLEDLQALKLIELGRRRNTGFSLNPVCADVFDPEIQ